jgi:uncharacterized membrane protein YsdA (DUF1294 family)
MGNTYQKTGSGCLSPYVLYGIIAFFPAIILTLIINGVWFTDWDWPFTWLVAQNVVTFFVYGFDKKIAPSNAVRVPEVILLLEVLSGACVGALVARMVFHHKTRKRSFRLEFWAAELFSIALVVLYAYRYFM